MRMIYAYGLETMFKSGAEVEPQRKAICNFRYLEQAPRGKEDISAEQKCLVDYIKEALPQDTVFSLPQRFFDASLAPAVAALPRTGLVDGLWTKVREVEGEQALLPAPTGGDVAHRVFAKVVNVAPQNRHTQFLPGHVRSVCTIVVNRLKDCFQTADGWIAFNEIDPSPVHMDLLSAAAVDFRECVASLAIWKVAHPDIHKHRLMLVA